MDMIAVAAAALVICNLAEKCIFKYGFISLIVSRGIFVYKPATWSKIQVSPDQVSFSMR